MLTAEKKDGNQDGAQMKINKQKLKQIILEELTMLENENDQTKLRTKAMSTSQRQQTVRDRIKGQGDEFTTNEQGLVDQLETFISNLASEPGVDLVQHRPFLQRILALLQKQIQGTPQQPEQGAQE
tara:strand:- start:1566 stop:1943 length:378 start_codon:yes stop_codon:yes gene_type:complete